MPAAKSVEKTKKMAKQARVAYFSNRLASIVDKRNQLNREIRSLQAAIMRER
jgi:hypothetical protein